MNRKNRLLIVLLSVIFCFSAFTLSVYAVGEGDGEFSDVVPDDNPGDENSGGEVVIPPENSGGDNGNGDNGDNNGGNGDNTGDNGNTGNNGGVIDDNNGNGDYNGGYVDDNNSSSYVDNNNYDYNNGYDNNYGYEDQGGYEQDYNNDESSYIGGGQTYIAPENTAPSASLYNSSGTANDKTLNNNDWNDISERLKNASNSADDGDDFSFIQKNNSLSDNGGWMLIVSILCFALSAAGILYFVVSTLQNKKKNRLVPAANSGRTQKSSASRDYYGDVYKANSSKNFKRSSKFDTAEVSLPKNTQGKRYKNGGKRYR